MKFEFSSRFRNRNSDPVIGDFGIEPSSRARGKDDALDPVCLSAPSLAWVPGFVYSGTISAFSALDDINTSILVTTSSPLTPQATIRNFLTGCVVTANTIASLNLRVLFSEPIGTNQILLTVPRTELLNLGRAINISDYTSFPSNIRAPLSYDLGQFKYIYNETLDQYLTIDSVDMTTRKFFVKETSAPGWLLTHNLTIRSDIPRIIATIVAGSTTNVIILSSALSSINNGDYLRLRSSNYGTLPLSTSWVREIVDVSGTNITIFPPLPSIPSIGGVVEVLPFSYDNYHPVTTYESGPSLHPYQVSLENLTIPNIRIKHGNLSSIPYLLVELNNTSSGISVKNLINSNNPFVQEGVWVAKLDTMTLGNKFLSFNNTDTSGTSQRLLMSVRDPLRMKIFLPNGALLDTLDPETSEPFAPWYDLNIWAVFNFRQ